MSDAIYTGLENNLRELILHSHEVILVAPFIKYATLQSLLAGSSLKSLTVYTRWKAEDVASGVSDLSVFDVLREHQTHLMLVDCLHAKYFRGDSTAILGSANLTRAGLGYPRGNLELQVQVSFSQSLQQFEEELRLRAYRATEALRDEIQRIANAMKRPEKNLEADTTEALNLRDWIPQTRYPQDVWKAYIGEKDRLSSHAATSTKYDLEHLQLPSGMSEDSFTNTVRYRIYRSFLVCEVDHFAVKSRRFGEMKRFLAKHLTTIQADSDPEYVWQTLFRWLLYFMPDRYEAWTTNYSEIFQRVS